MRKNKEILEMEILQLRLIYNNNKLNKELKLIIRNTEISEMAILKRSLMQNNQMNKE
jgi:hypothetical protein